ncbi:MAG: hypothetical protein ACH37Z_11500 [Anaerolineae bacterium]
MACVDAPHAVGTVLQALIDAPHATGCQLGIIDAPHAVGTVMQPMIDAPHATGARLFPAAFHEIFVKGPTAVDESGVTGGPGDGTGGASEAGAGPRQTVASEAAMLALTLSDIETGEYVLRTDYSKADPNSLWRFTGTIPSNPAHWEVYTIEWPWSGGASQPASTCILPNVTHMLSSWVGDLSDYLYRVSLSESANQMLQGTIQLAHYNPSTGLITSPTPFHPEGGSLALDAHNMTEDRTLTLRVTTASKSYTYPTLLPGDISIDAEGVVTVPVTDLTPLLMIEGQHMDDIMADDGDTRDAHSVMQEIGDAYGVKIICRGWPTYYIRELRRSDGNPLQWLDALAAPYRAARRWEGSTLIYEVSDGGGTTYPLEDRFRIETASWALNTSGMRNSWIANRLQPTPGQLAYEKRDGRDTLGFIGGEGGIQFTAPARYALVLPKVVGGGVDAGVFFDAAGTPIGTGNIYLGSTPAVAWRGNYVPSMPWASENLIPGYEVRVLGTAATANTRHFPMDDRFDADLTSAALITIYGERPEYRSLDNPIVPTSAVNDDQLAAIQREVELSIVRSSWGTPWFNPLLRPRVASVVITDHDLRQAAAAWRVDGVQTEMREPGDWYQSLSCTKAREAA